MTTEERTLTEGQIVDGESLSVESRGDGSLWEAQMQEHLLEALEDYRRGVAEAPCVFKWSLMGAVASEPGQALRQAQDERGPGAAEWEAGSDWQRKEMGAGTVEDGGAMTFVASTEEVDRHGDVVSVSGWKLDGYRKNPVFLWAHDYSRPAIGRTTQVWTSSAGKDALAPTLSLASTVSVAPTLSPTGSGGTGGLTSPALLVNVEFAPTPFAQEVAALYRGGYQKGVSVGFRPVRFEERRHPQTGKFMGIRFTEQVLLEVSAAPVPANENAVRRASGLAGGMGLEGRLALLERRVEEMRRGGYGGLGLSGGLYRGLPQVLEVLREARAGP